ncbi:MAG: potassium channel family protein [Candidatus Micrarchaeia archaeon]
MDTNDKGAGVSNILLASVIIVLILGVISVLVIFLLFHNAYLATYYVFQTFFDASNVNADTVVAGLTMSNFNTDFYPVFIIFVVDNISRIVIMSFILAAVIDMVAYADIENRINRLRAMRRRGHLIICSYNNLSQAIIDKLKNNSRIIMIVKSKNEVLELMNRGIIALEGDFTSEATLKAANIEGAKAIIFASEDDLDNLLGAISAKRLNKDATVITRVGREETRTKMYRVGVDMCVLPEYLSGIEIGEAIARSFKGDAR